MSDQQTGLRQRRMLELSRAISRTIAEYAHANPAELRVDDGDALNALLHTIVELLAHTSSFNRDIALRILGPEVAREVERCALHYAQPESRRQ
jgi:hypothetical protein